MKDDIGTNDCWSVGISRTDYDKSGQVNHLEGDKLSREPTTVYSFDVGSLFFITTLKEWGVGIVIEIDSVHETLYIHWQRLNITKWHNAETLLHYLQKDMINTNRIEKTSFILKRERDET